MRNPKRLGLSMYYPEQVPEYLIVAIERAFREVDVVKMQEFSLLLFFAGAHLSELERYFNGRKNPG